LPTSETRNSRTSCRRPHKEINARLVHARDASVDRGDERAGIKAAHQILQYSDSGYTRQHQNECENNERDLEQHQHRKYGDDIDWPSAVVMERCRSDTRACKCAENQHEQANHVAASLELLAHGLRGCRVQPSQYASAPEPNALQGICRRQGRRNGTISMQALRVRCTAIGLEIGGNVHRVYEQWRVAVGEIGHYVMITACAALHRRLCSWFVTYAVDAPSKAQSTWWLDKPGFVDHHSRASDSAALLSDATDARNRELRRRLCIH
jgi:hypothetical protein